MINNLEKDFRNLVAAAGSKEERTVLNEFFEKYQLHEKGIESLLKKSVDKAGKQVEELSVRIQLHKATKMINLSFIAEKYFKRSKAWLSQRINGNIVNGKPAKFTKEEIETLNFALKDMGKKISSITIHG